MSLDRTPHIEVAIKPAEQCIKAQKEHFAERLRAEGKWHEPWIRD